MAHLEAWTMGLPKKIWIQLMGHISHYLSRSSKRGKVEEDLVPESWGFLCIDWFKDCD